MNAPLLRVIAAALLALCLARAAPAADVPTLEAGQFEGLMLAIDPAGTVTGYYREQQGEGVTKTCTFFLSGRATANPFDIVTWSKEVFSGTLKSVGKDVELKIARGRDHPGCRMVLLPEIAEGLVLERSSKAKWIGLRVVTAPRAYFHAKPDDAEKRRVFVVKGDVVAVLAEDGDWLDVAYPGEKKTTQGWIHAAELAKPMPPGR